MGDWRSEFAVAVHEAYEAIRCEEEGITQAQVDQFDQLFEKAREAGKYGENDEPGDDPAAPYGKMHEEATLIENVITTSAGLRWSQHEDNVNALP